jgi:hypothetical protein
VRVVSFIVAAVLPDSTYIDIQRMLGSEVLVKEGD